MWNSIAFDAKRRGLATVVDAYEKGLAHEDVMNSYKKNLYKTLVNETIDSEPVLTAFSGTVFNEKIEQFK